jgi:hypothetical protein
MRDATLEEVITLDHRMQMRAFVKRLEAIYLRRTKSHPVFHWLGRFYDPSNNPFRWRFR